MGKSKAPKVEVNEYLMSMHLGICWGPVEALTGILIGEKLVWEGNQNVEGTLGISQPFLWGGNKKEGGVFGHCHFMKGNDTQTMPNNLAYRFGLSSETCPAFNNLAAMFFISDINSPVRGFTWGANSPYLRDVWARVMRRSNVLPALDPSENWPNGSNNFAVLGGVYSQITNQVTSFDQANDANPAHMIYECLINTDWGMGSSPDIIDIRSFQLAAQYHAWEGFGLSMMWSQQSTIEEFVSEILDHVQGTLYVNNETGLITLKLIRGDYYAYELDELNPDNCTVTNFQRKGWGETINEINVTWTNPQTEEEETVTMHDLANIEMQGEIVSDTRNYYGIRRPDLAAMVAARDIRSAAAPLASFEISANRSMWKLPPGGVIRLTYPDLGITDLVIRVTDIDYGKPGDSDIKIVAMEDIFSLPISAYQTPPSSGWVDTSADPTDLNYFEIVSLPYYFAADYLNTVGGGVIEYPETLAGVLGGSTNRDTQNFELYGQTTSPTGDVAMTALGTKAITSHMTLTAALDAEAVSNVSGAELGMASATVGKPPEVSRFVYIGTDEANAELALISYVADGFASIILERGVLDTTPKAWPIGTPVWILDDVETWADGTVFAEGSLAVYKGLTNTSKGQLPIESASSHYEYLVARAHLPTRPGDVAVGSVGFGKYTQTGTGDLNVSWATRNRLTEDAQIVLWEDGAITPELGQTTNVYAQDQYGNTLTAHLGLSGNSFVLPYASFLGQTKGFVKVEAEKDGFESLQGHRIEVEFLP